MNWCHSIELCWHQTYLILLFMTKVLETNFLCSIWNGYRCKTETYEPRGIQRERREKSWSIGWEQVKMSESKFNLTDGYLWLLSFVPSIKSDVISQNYQVISASKLRLSHSVQWLLFATTTVEIQIPVVYAMHEQTGLETSFDLRYYAVWIYLQTLWSLITSGTQTPFFEQL